MKVSLKLFRSIGTRLSFSVLLVLILSGVVALFSYRTILKIRTLNNWVLLSSNDEKVTEQIKFLSTQIIYNNKKIERFQYSERLNSAIREMDHRLNILKNGDPSKKIPAMTNRHEIMIILEDNEKLWSERIKPALELQSELSKEESLSQFSGITNLLKVFVDSTQKRNQISNKLINKEIGHLTKLQISYSCFALLIFTSILFFVRSIVRRLSALAKAADQISKASIKNRRFSGFLTQDIGNDEIAGLNRSLEQMVRSLEKSKNELSKRVMAEAEAKSVKESQQYIENIFQSLTEMLFALNSDGTIRMVNSRVSELLGYSENELTGKSFDSIIEKNEEGLQFFNFSKIDQIIKGEIIRSEKLTFLTKENERILAHVSGNALKRADSTVKDIILSAVDMREHFSLQAQVQQSERLASIGELAAGVGHEINNPLAIAMGNLAKGKKQLELLKINDNILNTTFDRQFESLKRIKTIVDGLRTYARMDTDYKCPIDLHDLTRKSIDLVQSMYEKEGVSIHSELNATSFKVNGNMGKFQQVLINFITNARDATEEKQDRKISISTKSADGKIVLSISDNGCGIPENIRNRIFDAFFTTKPVGKGTGMGLGISLKIIKEMEGTLEVSSEVGQGTTFEITFPLSKEKEATESHENKGNEKKKLTGLALVVDDEEGIRELLRETLEDLGIEVEEADDGDTALEMVKTKKYDYICSDMKMPRMPGIEFIRAAKKLPNGNARYFIITGGVTTNYSKEARDELWKIADGYILKPFSEETIYQTFIKVLNDNKTKTEAA